MSRRCAIRPYSQDLRDRILAVAACGEGSLREIAERFLVDVSTIVRLLQRYRRTGSTKPEPHAGGRRPALGPTISNGFGSWSTDDPTPP
jgi:transposase